LRGVARAQELFTIDPDFPTEAAAPASPMPVPKMLPE